MTAPISYLCRNSEMSVRAVLMLVLCALVGGVGGWLYGRGQPVQWRVTAQLSANWIPINSTVRMVVDDEQWTINKLDAPESAFNREKMEFFINSELAALRSTGLVQETLDSLAGEVPGLDLDTEAWESRLRVQRTTKAQNIQVSCVVAKPPHGVAFIQRLLEKYLEAHAKLYRQQNANYTDEELAAVEQRLAEARTAITQLGVDSGIIEEDTVRADLLGQRADLQSRQRRLAADIAEATAVAAKLRDSLSTLPERSVEREAADPAVAAELEALLADLESAGAGVGEAARSLRTALTRPLAVVQSGRDPVRGAVERALVEAELRVAALEAQLGGIDVELREIDTRLVQVEEVAQRRAGLMRDLALARADAIETAEAVRLAKVASLAKSNAVVISSKPIASRVQRSARVPDIVLWAGGGALLALLIGIAFVVLRTAIRDEMSGGLATATAPRAEPRWNWGLLMAIAIFSVPTLFSRESIFAPPFVRDHFAKGVEAMALVGLAVWAVRQRWIPRLNLPLALAALFLVWMAMSGLWAPHFAGYKGQLTRLLHSAIAGFALYLAIRTRRDLEWAMVAWKAVSALFALFILVELTFPGWRLAGRLVGGLLEIGQTDANPDYRASGPVGHPNWVGFFLALTILLQPYFWVRYRSVGVRLLLLAISVLEVYGLFKANVRAGTLTVLVGMVWLVFRGAFRYRLVPILLMLIGCVGLWHLAPPAWKHRASLERGEGDRSTRKRVSQLFASLDLTNQHGALGVGYGGFGNLFYQEADGYAVEMIFAEGRIGTQAGEYPVENIGGHNAYLEVVLEGGIVGILLFVGVGLALYLGAFSSVYRNKGDPAARQLGMVFEAVVISMAILLIVLHGQERRALWTVVGLCSAYASLSRAGLMASSAETVTPTGQAG